MARASGTALCDAITVRRSSCDRQALRSAAWGKEYEEEARERLKLYEQGKPYRVMGDKKTDR